MNTRLTRVLSLSLLTFAAACGDPGLTTIPGGDKPEYQGEGYKMEIVTPMPLVLQTSATGLLTVRLTRSGEPVSGASVEFTVDGSRGGAHLGALRATTSNTGEASVEVIAGAEAADFRIAMESQYTTIMYADVSVRAPGDTGTSLEVQVAYPDQGTNPVSTVTIGVYDGSQTCEALLSSTNLPAPLEAPQDLTDLAGSVTFSSLGGATKVSILAVGKNANKAPVADGCVEGMDLVLGQANSTTVNMSARSMRLQGTYDYTATFDMTGAIPGLAGDVFTEVAAFAQNPAAYLVGKVEALYCGSSDPKCWYGWLRDAAVNAVDSLIQRYLPDTLLNFLTWVGDATKVVTNLTVEGTLTIADDPNGGGGLQATEVWQYVVFTWQGKCDLNANPLCDQRRIALRNTRIGELTATYAVTNEDPAYRVAQHTRSIPYLRFFHLFLLQVVYPELVPGATSTTDVLNNAVDCKAVADWIDGADSAGQDGQFDAGIATISVADLENYCHQGVSAIGGLIDGKIDKLANAVPSDVTLTGAAEIVDENADLLADRLQNGVWQGTIDVDGSPNAVSGSFEASRN